MRKTLEIQIRVMRQKISPGGVRALKRLEKYDWILFASKNAAKFFVQELRERRVALPRAPRTAAVGPVTAAVLHALKFKVNVVPEYFTARDLIRSIGDVKNTRILFPRSAIASNEVVRALRARGARVNVISLYTTVAKQLPKATKQALLKGAYAQLIFKSPSGVQGLMRQLSTREQQKVQHISIRCIGLTTARAARAAGFKKISIKSI